MAEGRFVSYLRVSTKRQGDSGLGLEAQRKAVTDHLNGGSWDLISEFVEVEKGGRNDRPQLAQALRLCRVHGATLLVAKLDRLSRDDVFLLTLQRDLQRMGLRFVAADMPEANELTIGIMAVVAKAERKMISTRTKAALAAAKAKGVKMGGFRGKLPTDQDRARSAEVVKARANDRAADLLPILDDIRAGGATSLREIAAELNKRGIPTARGGEWSAVQVSRVLARTA